MDHEVEMSAKERKLYDQLKRDLIIPLEDGDIDAVNAASLTGKLLQMSNGAVYDENREVRSIHSRKHARLGIGQSAPHASRANRRIPISSLANGIELSDAGDTRASSYARRSWR